MLKPSKNLKKNLFTIKIIEFFSSLTYINYNLI